MNRPTYEVRRMRQGGYEIEGYAVDEQYEGEPAQTVTAGHPTRIAAEASAAAIQGAIERFAAWLAQSPTCQLAGPGRGDCEAFVGLPAVFDESTTDHYGKPLGWCWYCWHQARIKELELEVDRLRDR